MKILIPYIFKIRVCAANENYNTTYFQNIFLFAVNENSDTTYFHNMCLCG